MPIDFSEKLTRVLRHSAIARADPCFVDLGRMHRREIGAFIVPPQMRPQVDAVNIRIGMERGWQVEQIVKACDGCSMPEKIDRWQYPDAFGYCLPNARSLDA